MNSTLLTISLVGSVLGCLGLSSQALANPIGAHNDRQQEAARDRITTATDRAPDGQTQRGKKLGERLIRQAHGDADEDVMDTILRLMSSAAQRLEIELDAGEETQAVQRQIMDQLDTAIKIAGVRRRVRSRDQEPARGDKRRRHQDDIEPQQKQADSKEAGQRGSSSAKRSGAASRPEGDRSGGRLYESRRTWGQLPRRQREEVIQGITEEYLQRFRAWIERYYQALQESGDSDAR